MELSTEIKQLTRVGATTAKRLESLGLKTAGDLLNYFPFRYEDFRTLTPIADLEPGQNVSVVGRIELIKARRSPRRRLFLTEAIVTDESERLKVIWFNQPYLAKTLKPGDTVSLAGKIDEDASGPVMRSPVYEKLGAGGTVHTQGVIPIYHTTAGLTQKQLRFLIHLALPLSDRLSDWLPTEVQEAEKLLPLGDAVRTIHFPADFAANDAARKRLAYDELFLLQLRSLLAKRELLHSRALSVPFAEQKTKQLVASLPFTLTAAQKKAAWTIIRDLEKPHPMARLMQGDVGSGKTVVALIAMANAAAAGCQSALMVPTDILARQHFHSVRVLLGETPYKIGLLTGSAREASWTEDLPKKTAADIIAKEADIIIGTHALIQSSLSFRNLALSVIDEQHRFGVDQRRTLAEQSGNGATPHLLSMTATPIPRTLALALYGDLSLTVIDELPQGRQPIGTHIVPEPKRGAAYDFIRKEIAQGRQAFVICPLVEESDTLGIRSAQAEYERLSAQIFPDLAVGLVHGRLKAKERDATMAAFAANEIKILVATAVVEVGVDVPNATIMMIEGADRFGLAQLHQFRGRVGRAQHKSYCFLFTANDSPRVLKRLEAMTTHHSGQELAKIDLQMRGPGELYGTAQKGFPELRIATLFDYDLMLKARAQGERLLKDDPKLEQHPMVLEKLAEQQPVHGE